MQKILSLDCWGTLVKARESFWVDYSLMIKELTNASASPAEIMHISRLINRDFDEKSNQNKKSYNQEDRLRALVEVITENGSVQTGTLESIVCNIGVLIDSPQAYFNKLTDELPKSVTKRYSKIVLCSNTGFISGTQTSKILNKVGYDIFDAYFYSDAIDAPKPTRDFVEYLVAKLNLGDSLILEHFGDDPVCDNLTIHSNFIKSTILTNQQALHSLLAT